MPKKKLLHKMQSSSNKKELCFSIKFRKTNKNE